MADEAVKIDVAACLIGLAALLKIFL